MSNISQHNTAAPRRIVLAVTGASGMPYAATLARALGERPDIELHCIVSNAAGKVLELETGAGVEAITAHAHRAYTQDDIGAGPASGSWRHDGMIVCPCSMATLAAIASGVGTNLIHRAADVTLKERRRLVLVTRETPLGRIHIENMLRAEQAGAIIMPPCPGFYLQPQSVQELVNQFCGRVLDMLNVPHALSGRWEG
ncbi:4-hydroxy-3-polyprenylbenzoate decarboxylase [Desulfobaculum xiamenense]|uniref:Flavin prenyltransferase UbiX n=1 Tax=Desulfobaculum xiamenense TaxID=995050 RepID=A0A846QJM3_9BACT|nr:UbiX family flavin prenyltransferase [Desulfobaculum xiamenense]NJB67297.1 4-hydroxy-3-polyprenylbenzoate decarboxylase [Desulfobaculum xiamenense]